MAEHHGGPDQPGDPSLAHATAADRRPAASGQRWFWVGAGLVLAGVLAHVPDYLKARHDNFMMAGMPMGTTMSVGMVLIVVGLVVAGRVLFVQRAGRSGPTTANLRFAALDDAPLTRAHWSLVGVLTIGLVVDTMKPASLGFVVPGMEQEYGITTGQAAALPFVALVGTVFGSILWGYLADFVGRRSTIMVSGLIYVATSICGFMPSLRWNLVMCFAMGASAGGMLPTVYSLMSESVPARQRGWLLVMQSGLGAALGYLVASGSAAALIPHLSWRAVWLLNAPTGGLLLALIKWIPESPRYLLAHGRTAEAEQVMARYGIAPKAVTPATNMATLATPAAAPPARPADARPADTAPTDASPAKQGQHPGQDQPAKQGQHPGQDQPAGQGAKRRPLELLSAAYRRQTIAILLYGLGWGVVNWGFITFLPVFLTSSGMGGKANTLLFVSALLAIPSTVLAAALYARWSSRKSMLLYSAITVVVLLLFAMLRPDRSGPTALLVLICTLLLASTSGMIAMLSPYATEVYPTSLRATGSGFAAAASKIGGLFGPVVVLGTGTGLLTLISTVPVTVAAIVLWRTGQETAGRPLVETHHTQHLTEEELNPTA